MPIATKVKLKRTTKAENHVDVAAVTLDHGEPFIVSQTASTVGANDTNTYLYVGDSTGTSHIADLKVFKALPRDQVDQQLFYVETGHSQESTNVYLENEQGDWLVPEVVSNQVYWDDAETSTVTVKDKITALDTRTQHIDGNTYYATSTSALNGVASNSARLSNTKAVGSTTLPVYFTANGVPSACSTSLAVSVTGNAATSTNATNVMVQQSNSTKLYLTGVTATSTTNTARALKQNSNIYISTSNVLMGAAWNDFAERRKCSEKAGTCVAEVGDGSLTKTITRMQGGCSIVSDTYGMLIGPEGDDMAAIAVAGRVLAYPDSDVSLFKPGEPVCSGENGTVSIMTRGEIRKYPDRIVGYVSEIPTYKKWNDTVKVDGRIWIKVK